MNNLRNFAGKVNKDTGRKLEADVFLRMRGTKACLNAE